MAAKQPSFSFPIRKKAAQLLQQRIVSKGVSCVILYTRKGRGYTIPKKPNAFPDTLIRLGDARHPEEYLFLDYTCEVDLEKILPPDVNWREKKAPTGFINTIKIPIASLIKNSKSQTLKAMVTKEILDATASGGD